MTKENTMIGVGLRPSHYPELEANSETKVDWFEAISENYMNTEGRPLKMLLHVRKTYPVALHGVGLSIGSHDGVSQNYLNKLKALVNRVDPVIVSDHFCWSSIGGHYSHDLLPFPFHSETLDTLCENVEKVQDFLGKQICLENISYYLKSKTDEMSESHFINEVCKRTGCGLLLDLNNVDVNARNHGFGAFEFCKELDFNNVKQIHLAGPSQEEGFVFDTHSTPVPDSVWELYRQFIGIKEKVPVIIEWDENIPSFQVLEEEVHKARNILSSLEANP
ncbi:MAG: hypothetical protein A4S09_14870 [Proteobacteria bacterium SG_bin7]|nr:MAG: hypothetical protein A4S09_14870 [Proteobacteria bacterium SG_bin7]